MRHTRNLGLAAVGAAVGAVALAASLMAQTTDHSGHNMAGHSMTGQESPATVAFMEANAKMHTDMAIAFTGDADVDFIAGMIPHHQGAVEMAKIVLEHGKDPEVRKLAEGIIAAQESEIAWMTDWLAKHGK